MGSPIGQRRVGDHDGSETITPEPARWETGGGKRRNIGTAHPPKGKRPLDPVAAGGRGHTLQQQRANDMAIFDRLDRITSRQVDRMFSVAATIDCMKATPNGRPQPDTARGEIFCRGILDCAEEYAAVEMKNRDRSGNDLNTIVTGAGFFFFGGRDPIPGRKGCSSGRSADTG